MNKRNLIWDEHIQISLVQTILHKCDRYILKHSKYDEDLSKFKKRRGNFSRLCKYNNYLFKISKLEMIKLEMC